MDQVFSFWLLVDEVVKMLLRDPFEPFHHIRDAAVPVRLEIRAEVRADSFSPLRAHKTKTRFGCLY